MISGTAFCCSGLDDQRTAATSMHLTLMRVTRKPRLAPVPAQATLPCRGLSRLTRWLGITQRAFARMPYRQNGCPLLKLFSLTSTYVLSSERSASRSAWSIIAKVLVPRPTVPRPLS